MIIFITITLFVLTEHQDKNLLEWIHFSVGMINGELSTRKREKEDNTGMCHMEWCTSWEMWLGAPK